MIYAESHCLKVLEKGIFKSSREFKKEASFKKLLWLIRIGLISIPPRLV